MSTRLSLLPSVACLVALSLGACKSPNMSSGTARSMASVNTDLEAASKQLGTTMSALEQLSAAAAASKDLQQPYNQFSSALSSLMSKATAISSRSEDMKKNADQYFAAWGQNVEKLQNEDIRKMSQEQLDDLKKKLADVQKQFASVADAWKPLRQNLNDMQVYLKSALNEDSVKALSDQIAKAKDSAATVQSGIAKGSSMLEELRKSISATPDMPQQPASGT